MRDASNARRWKVALIDSGCAEPLLEQARFNREGAGPFPTLPDPTGHGSRLASILHTLSPRHDLILGQVFEEAGPTTTRAVVAAMRWAMLGGADLIHLSLGLQRDDPVLAQGVAEALERQCLIIAAAPARGQTVYPAGYPGVIVGTGDARCQSLELSRLGPGRFGGCPSVRTAQYGSGHGASVGAAHVTAAILRLTSPGSDSAQVLSVLGQSIRYDGPERRTGPTV